MEPSLCGSPVTRSLHTQAHLAEQPTGQLVEPSTCFSHPSWKPQPALLFLPLNFLPLLLLQDFLLGILEPLLLDK